MTGARRPQLNVAAWRLLGGLALTLCLGGAALVVPSEADAATNWAVARGGVGGGTGLAEPTPAAPGGVNSACVSVVGWTIKVTWNAVPHTTTYTIYRSTTSATSGFSVYGTVPGGTTSYSDANFSVLTSYWYRITATVGANWIGPQSASTPKRSISLLLVCS